MVAETHWLIKLTVNDGQAQRFMAPISRLLTSSDTADRLASSFVGTHGLYVRLHGPPGVGDMPLDECNPDKIHEMRVKTGLYMETALATLECRKLVDMLAPVRAKL